MSQMDSELKALSDNPKRKLENWEGSLHLEDIPCQEDHGRGVQEPLFSPAGRRPNQKESKAYGSATGPFWKVLLRSRIVLGRQSRRLTARGT